MNQIATGSRFPLWMKVAVALAIIWVLGAASAAIGQLGGSAPPEQGRGVELQRP